MNRVVAGRVSAPCKAVGTATSPCGLARRAGLPAKSASAGGLSSRRVPAGGHVKPRGTVCKGAPSDTDTEISEGIKAAVLELLDEDSDSVRVQLNEMLYQLESRNPTPYPTTSPLLNGEWEFKYLPGIAPGPVPSPTREIAMLMYAGGYTPGKFALDLSKRLPSSLLDISQTKIAISASQPRGKITASVKVLNNSFPVELRTSIEAESDVRMREVYLDAEAVGRDITLPQQLQTERVFYITYLDEDLLISRDESGTPDVLYRVGTANNSSSSGEAAASEGEGTSPGTGAGEEEEVTATVEPDAAIAPEASDDDDKSDAAYSW